MQSNASFLSYNDTGYFSKIVTDYVDNSELIQPFFNHAITKKGILLAMAERKKFATNRNLLQAVLRNQYNNIQPHPIVISNIEAITDDNTFTICTAHQPNIFTGHLYFIYKILHTIKIADWLNNEIDSAHFIPVYYMGSEDADIAELGHFFINGEKFEWSTTQTGAVGRMKVDNNLVELLNTAASQLEVHPHGSEIVELMKKFYVEGATIEQATVGLVNELFGKYGLLIILPDNALLKAAYAPVIERELLEEFSHKAVAETIADFPSSYKAQASGREINMFYMLADKRERIVLQNDSWKVLNTTIAFTKQQLIEEIINHPERFSPNVILRPVFQEWILPNIAFIGGGGEIAYWLQLKKVFEATGVPYPMLVLRNSFMIADNKSKELLQKLSISLAGIFKNEHELLNEIVLKQTSLQLSLTAEKEELAALYQRVQNIAGKVDVTLANHTTALHKKAEERITTLEKKILRAEKRKFEAAQRQLHNLKTFLFPNDNLQERVENLMLFYAKWGPAFVHTIYQHSLSFEQQFTILTEKPGN